MTKAFDSGSDTRGPFLFVLILVWAWIPLNAAAAAIAGANLWVVAAAALVTALAATGGARLETPQANLALTLGLVGQVAIGKAVSFLIAVRHPDHHRAQATLFNGKDRVAHNAFPREGGTNGLRGAGRQE